MGKTTRRTQAAAQKRVADIQPNQPTGRKAPPALPPNAFLGKSERVPQFVYIPDTPGDGFLGQARQYYEFFGLTVRPVRSVHEIVIDLGRREGVLERIAVVSHAHPRGMLLPMFTGATVGTNKDVFNELAKGDYEGLLSMSPFSAVTHHLFTWNGRIDQLMKLARTRSAAALKPFGLDKSGTPPAGDMSEFFFHCFDAVFLGIPGNVTLNGGALGAADRGTLQDFVDEILNQLAKRLDGKTVNGQRVTVQALTALRAGLTSLPFADMNIVATFDLNLTRDNMNFFTSLAAMVRAVRGGLRDQIDTARTHFTATSLIDVRGCRVAQDPEYIEAIGAFFGKPGARPTVTGPHFFQAYGQFAFDTLGNRAQVRTWLSAERRMHPPQRLRELLTKWAEIIRVKPLHTDFWMGILTGPAVRLVALTKDDVPKLFIQAPGIPQITDPDIRKSIRALADFFNVAPASVPPTPDMTSLNAAAPRVRSAAAALLASVTDQTGAARLQELYEKLRDIDQAESQSIVPDTPPTPLNATHIRDFQKGLLEYFDATPLAPLKRFMSAAATSLNEGDGLYYYMFFAGLPVFIFGRPEAQKNSLVVFTPHERVVLQSWYQCLWKDPLPDNRGDYRTARVTINPLTHTMPSHVGDDRRSIESICPLPRYGLCIRTRPLPADEVDGECGSLSNP